MSDREKRLERALRRLSFAAQTTGGTAGRDGALVAAIAQADEALADDAAGGGDKDTCPVCGTFHAHGMRGRCVHGCGDTHSYAVPESVRRLPDELRAEAVAGCPDEYAARGMARNWAISEPSDRGRRKEILRIATRIEAALAQHSEPGRVPEGWVHIDDRMPPAFTHVALCAEDRYENAPGVEENRVKAVGYLNDSMAGGYWSIMGERAADLRSFPWWSPLAPAPDDRETDGRDDE